MSTCGVICKKLKATEQRKISCMKENQQLNTLSRIDKKYDDVEGASDFCRQRFEQFEEIDCKNKREK